MFASKLIAKKKELSPLKEKKAPSKKEEDSE
jgi:hypothetical protein